MIDKITYDNGKIRSGFDTFKCEDDADMERLCNTINSMFVENAIQNHKMDTQLLLIKEVLNLRE
jgi:hypothetical protein